MSNEFNVELPPELLGAFKDIVAKLGDIESFVKKKDNSDLIGALQKIEKNITSLLEEVKVSSGDKGDKLSRVIEEIKALDSIGDSIKKIKFPPQEKINLANIEKTLSDIKSNLAIIDILKEIVESSKNKSFTVANFNDMPMPLGLAKESTLESLNKFGVPSFDEEEIDETNKSATPSVIVITYKNSGTVVATKTITKTGSVTNIKIVK